MNPDQAIGRIAKNITASTSLPRSLTSKIYRPYRCAIELEERTLVDASQQTVQVLISYSHDSLVHKDRVLSFCCRLLEEGINAELDQFNESPPEGWPRWMTQKLKEVDYVLTVITETYAERFEGNGKGKGGHGSDFEGKLITQLLYNDKSLNSRVIPICFSAEDRRHTPTILQSETSYDVTNAEEYTRLYSVLTSQQILEKPSIGRIKPLVRRKIRSHQFLDAEETTICENSEGVNPTLLSSEPGGPNDDSGVAVCQATGSQLIELHINREYKTFSDADQEELMKAIKVLLGISTDLRITNKRPGSVFLTIDLSPADADQLLWHIRNGDLARFDVIDASLLSDTQRAVTHASPLAAKVTAHRMSVELFQQQPDWATFFREVLGVGGLVRKLFPSPESLAEFEKTEEYVEIQAMVAKLRARSDANQVGSEPTRVITVRLPKSLRDALREEAQNRNTTMNQLCISKLLQVIDEQLIPSE